MGWDKILEIVSHITHPVSVAGVALVLVAYLAGVALKKPRSKVVWFLIALILLIGLAPLASSTYLQSRGLYIVRVAVLGIDKQPVDNARVTSSVGGDPKKTDGGWEFDVPPQSRPADGSITLYASVRSAFLTGRSRVVLDKDFFPIVEIYLDRDTSAVVRGVVVDDHQRSIEGAQVSIAGYTDSVLTNEMGNFALPAHAADGQIVHLRAQKGRLTADVSVPAGSDVTIECKRP
jgi:hypothetical protein